MGKKQNCQVKVMMCSIYLEIRELLQSALERCECFYKTPPFQLDLDELAPLGSPPWWAWNWAHQAYPHFLRTFPLVCLILRSKLCKFSIRMCWSQTETIASMNVMLFGTLVIVHHLRIVVLQLPLALVCQLDCVQV